MIAQAVSDAGVPFSGEDEHMMKSLARAAGIILVSPGCLLLECVC